MATTKMDDKNTTFHGDDTTDAINGTENTNISLNGEFTMQMVYVAIGCVGMCGNSLVLGVISSSKRMRKSTTNILIANQSAIDFSAAMFLVLTSLIRDVDAIHGLVAKELFCRLWMDNFPIWGLFVCSTYNLLAITLERYSAIIHPLRHRHTCSRGKTRVVLIFPWVWGLAYNLAYMVPSSPYKNGECTAYSEWPSALVQNIVGLLTIVVQYLLPLIIITFAYTRIVFVLMKSFKGSDDDKNTRTASHDVRREKMLLARKNVIKTLVLVAASFVVCWTPNQVLYTMYNLGTTVNFTGSFYHFTVIAVFLNCCMNPIIYCFQYDQFKAVLFGRCKKKQQPPLEGSIATRSGVISANDGSSNQSEVNDGRETPSSVYVVEIDNIRYEEDI